MIFEQKLFNKRWFKIIKIQAKQVILKECLSNYDHMATLNGPVLKKSLVYKPNRMINDIRDQILDKGSETYSFCTTLKNQICGKKNITQLLKDRFTQITRHQKKPVKITKISLFLQSLYCKCIIDTWHHKKE